MVISIAGRSLENHLETGRWRQPSNLGEVVSWFGAAWGGMGLEDLLRLREERMPTSMSAFLADGLLPSIGDLDIWEEEFIFREDNNPKHTFKLAQKWFEDQDITVLSWPAQSPDLNPIEHLWTTLKQKIMDYEVPAKGVWELWEWISAEWENITAEDCQKLIDHMPRRFQAVIKAKGGNTKY